MDVYAMMEICEMCGEECNELFKLGDMLVCESCLDNDTASMIISDDIEPTLDEFF